MLTGKPPFECPDVQSTLLKAIAGKFKLNWQISRQAQDLIRKLLTVDPDKRITIKEVLSHPFIADNCYALSPPEKQVNLLDGLRKQKEIEMKQGFETLNVDKENL